jgi:hypothetical protein
MISRKSFKKEEEKKRMKKKKNERKKFWKAPYLRPFSHSNVAVCFFISLLFFTSSREALNSL